jgi:predicted nucleotidyltransferase
MIRAKYIAGLRDLAAGLGTAADGSVWYLFGSVARDELDAADIDVIILCGSPEQADWIRAEINVDALCRPIDLSLMTFVEESETDAVARQDARQIYPDPG